MKDILKKYSNGEVTIVWRPNLCIHSGFCFHGLPQVFMPNKRPWVNANGATTEQIIAQVRECPSGALSFYMNDDEKEIPEPNAEVTIEVIPDGPLLVHGNLHITLANGSTELREDTTAFCRCGASHSKPYCDGAHLAIKFKG